MSSINKINSIAWLTLTNETATEQLPVDPAQGLSKVEAAKRLEHLRSIHVSCTGD